MSNVNPQQDIFCREYLKLNFNGYKAAVAAGYSERSARTQAARLLANDNIQERLAELMEERIKRTDIDVDYVLRQAVKLHERCMQEISPVTDMKGEQIYDGEGNPLYKFDAKGAAKGLELVGKHVNVNAFKETVDISQRSEVTPWAMVKAGVDTGEE